MNSRLKKWILVGVLSVAIITGLIAPFMFPTLLMFPIQRNIAVSLLCFIVGSITLFGGIKQHRAAKEKGVPLPWRKSASIIGSLQLCCMAAMFLNSALAYVPGEDGIGIILGTPFALLTIGLGIYALGLPRTNRPPKQSPAEFQQLPPTMQ